MENVVDPPQLVRAEAIQNYASSTGNYLFSPLPNNNPSDEERFQTPPATERLNDTMSMDTTESDIGDDVTEELYHLDEILKEKCTKFNRRRVTVVIQDLAKKVSNDDVFFQRYTYEWMARLALTALKKYSKSSILYHAMNIILSSCHLVGEEDVIRLVLAAMRKRQNNTVRSKGLEVLRTIVDIVSFGDESAFVSFCQEGGVELLLKLLEHNGLPPEDEKNILSILENLDAYARIYHEQEIFQIQKAKRKRILPTKSPTCVHIHAKLALIRLQAYNQKRRG